MKQIQKLCEPYQLIKLDVCQLFSENIFFVLQKQLQLPRTRLKHTNVKVLQTIIKRCFTELTLVSEKNALYCIGNC